MRSLRAGGVDVVAASRGGGRRFDWDEATWRPALEGVARLYALPPPADVHPQARMIPFFAQAIAAGVQRIVFLTTSAVDENDPGLGEVDRWIRRHTPEWTVLRPSWFMQNFFTPGHFEHDAVAEEGRIVSATAQGKLPFVDAEDVAAVAVVALADDAPHQAAHLVTGPEALSYDEVAQMLGVRHDALSPEAFARFVVGRGIHEPYATFLASLDALIAAGVQSTVSGAVQRLTGRPPRSFADLGA